MKAMKSVTLLRSLMMRNIQMENTLNERGVAVTRNGLSVAGQFFSLREMRGVTVHTHGKKKALPSVIAALGVGTVLAGVVLGSGAVLLIGGLLAATGWLTWATQGVTYSLWIDMPSGQREAIESPDRGFIERVANALDHAKEGLSG